MVLAFLHSQLCLFESKSSWEVFIKDGNFALCVISGESLSSFWIIKLYQEVKIGLPFLIINDGDMNLNLIFIFLHCYLLVDMLIIFWSSGCVINSSVSERIICWSYFNNGNFDTSITFSDRIVEALKFNALILDSDLVLLGRMVDLSFRSLQLNEIFLIGVNSCLFPVSKPLEERIRLQAVEKVLDVTTSWIFDF